MTSNRYGCCSECGKQLHTTFFCLECGQASCCLDCYCQHTARHENGAKADARKRNATTFIEQPSRN